MLCARCQKHEASFLYQKLVDGQVTESGLCDACRAEETPGVWIGDSPLSALFAVLGEPAHARKRLRCAACGLSFSEFRKCGRLGCPRCYDGFADAMDGVLTEVHGCARHAGKRPPPRDPAAVERAIEEAVASERFEDAARLRDRLAKLRKS